MVLRISSSDRISPDASNDGGLWVDVDRAAADIDVAVVQRLSICGSVIHKRSLVHIDLSS
jgi:hypothetical protein